MKPKEGKKASHPLLRAVLAILGVGVFFIAAAGLLPPRNLKTPWGVRERTSRYVAMPDGTRLAVRVILPARVEAGSRIPAVAEMTRYTTWYRRKFLYNLMINLGLEGVSKEPVRRFVDAGYAFVAVDSRGSGASFGTRPMECSREEAADWGPIVDWIEGQPWSNGKVASYGVSYSANTAELAAASGRTGLAAVLSLYADFDVPGENAMPGGIANGSVAAWSTGNIAEDKSIVADNPVVAGVAPVDGDRGSRLLKAAQAGHRTADLGAALSRITYFDEEIAPGYDADSLSPYGHREAIGKAGTPFYVRVGWMDSGTANGAIERFLGYPNPQVLVIGPWSHAGWHFYDPFLASGAGTPELDRAQSEEMIAFLDALLEAGGGAKGASTGASAPAAGPAGAAAPASGKVIRYYTFGEGVWKTTATWPVPGFTTRTLYAAADGRLSGEAPSAARAADRYEVDFGATTGTTNRWHTNYGGGRIGYPDRAAADRGLVVYTSEPLACDTEITGLPVATLEIASSATDGAFFVYLEDVAPDGKVSYITEGELRALHRKVSPPSPERATLGPRHSMAAADGEALEPSKPAELRIGMWATSVLVRAGHRIRLAIACADADTFARIPAEGGVTVDILRDALHATRLELPVLER